MTEAFNSKRIASNTAWLYLRMILILLVSLYTSRVILNALGVVDYGIYDVVGGVVALLGFLKSSLSGATSRFLAFEIGKKNNLRLKQTFEASIILHIALSVVVIILLETVGLWFVQNKLDIPSDRLEVAVFVFHFSVLASVINIMQVPFNAAVIAREKMDFFAIIGIIDAVLKLLIAYCINQSYHDKLAIYAFLVASEALIILIGYFIYCKRRFDECSFSFRIDKGIIKGMVTFSSWDLYGNMSVVVRSQGLSVLQNTFFGPIVNAATGISNQVMNGIMGFADNFLTAVKPQIIKLYAEYQIRSFLKLIITSSKFSFTLLLLISAPIFSETYYIMQLWLTQVPEWAVVFCQLSIINNWISIIFRPVIFGIHATGNAKRISLINGTIYISVLPISYIFLKNGSGPVVPFIINILLLLIGHTFFSLPTLHKYVRDFSPFLFIKSSFLPSFLVAIISLIPSFIVNNYMSPSFLRFIINFILTMNFVCLSSWVLIINSEEKKNISNFINNRMIKLKNK